MNYEDNWKSPNGSFHLNLTGTKTALLLEHIAQATEDIAACEEKLEVIEREEEAR